MSVATSPGMARLRRVGVATAIAGVSIGLAGAIGGGPAAIGSIGNPVRVTAPPPNKVVAIVRVTTPGSHTDPVRVTDPNGVRVT